LGLLDQELLISDLKFDGWNLTSNKTFYKTEDICKEGEDFDDEEDANSPVKKKKDPNNNRLWLKVKIELQVNLCFSSKAFLIEAGVISSLPKAV
jgi:hypothetical protein